jgi:hypothetical protein
VLFDVVVLRSLTTCGDCFRHKLHNLLSNSNLAPTGLEEVYIVVSDDAVTSFRDHLCSACLFVHCFFVTCFFVACWGLADFGVLAKQCTPEFIKSIIKLSQYQAQLAKLSYHTHFIRLPSVL